MTPPVFSKVEISCTLVRVRTGTAYADVAMSIDAVTADNIARTDDQYEEINLTKDER